MFADWLNRLRTDPNATFTGVVALFTLLLVIVGSVQAVRLRQTVENMKETERRQLRAYLGVESLELVLPGLSDPDYQVEKHHMPGYIHQDFVRIIFKNFGQTPAYDASIHVNWKPTPYAQRLPNDYAYPDFGVLAPDEVGPTVSRLMLQPTQLHDSRTAIFDVAPFRTTKARQTSLYLYGHIDYQDIYGRSWRTNFCYVWEPGTVREFVPYREHNNETTG